MAPGRSYFLGDSLRGIQFLEGWESPWGVGISLVFFVFLVYYEGSQWRIVIPWESFYRRTPLFVGFKCSREHSNYMGGVIPRREGVSDSLGISFPFRGLSSSFGGCSSHSMRPLSWRGCCISWLFLLCKGGVLWFLEEGLRLKVSMGAIPWCVSNPLEGD